MLTVSELRGSVNSVNYRQGEPRRVSILSSNPTVANKTLAIHAEARGTKNYHVHITFYNVDFSPEPDGEHPLSIRTRMGEMAFMSPVSEGENPVQVRCTCKDFEMRFSPWNRKHKALQGHAFPTYIRKTPPGSRPEMNAGELPGICKHIVGVLNRLNADKVLY